jgi:hypothetical protein
MKNGLILTVLAIFCFGIQAIAQQPEIGYYRPWDKNGINIFEPSKGGTQPAFSGIKVRIGGSFTQDYQSFTSSNVPTYVKSSATNKTNKNLLYGSIASEDSTTSKLAGFNLAMANLNIDVQIGDGIRVCLENYMSARHHNEFWVKGGYIMIDKLPMFGSPDWYTKYFRVKIGHFQPNFGDMQFRRSDGGNSMFNPFTENLILDAFSTEIGGELYVFPVDGFMGMVGMSSGYINGSILKVPDATNSYGVVANKRTPSIFAKVAYDKATESGLRFRLSASIYSNPNVTSNTLYAGDRTGSHYFGVMEPATINGLPVSIGTAPTDPTKQSGPNFTSGRFNPSMSNRITTVAINPFIKYKGLEIFADYQILSGSVYGDTLRADGRTLTWNKRTFNQLAIEGVYRFFANEQAYIGARYIKVSGEPAGMLDANKQQVKISIDRLSFVAGWFPTKNLLLKGEYVVQNYNDFLATDYRNGGKFNGFVVEAVIGF